MVLETLSANPQNEILTLFSTKEELELSFTVQQLDLIIQETTLVACNCTMLLPHETYTHIFDLGLFSLLPEYCGLGFSRKFDPSKAVEVQIGLDQSLLPEMQRISKLDPQEPLDYLGFMIRNGNINISLLQIENWYTLSALQQEGPIKSGFQTTWAETMRPKDPSRPTITGDF